MRDRQDLAAGTQARRFSPARLALRVLLHAVSLLIGLGALVAYEHFSLQGNSTASTVSLVTAGGFALSPIRALLHGIFAIEGRVLHAVHGIGGLALVGLTLGGVVPGGSLLSHGAMAPFAIMGAAQALMHSNQPRNAEQAAAMRQFVASLPEVEALSRPGDLTSPANASRAVAVLTDLVTKAQALGQTELKADPGFQGALRQTTTRVGLSLGLDAIDRAIGTLAANPATAGAVPDLRKRLAAARRTVGS